MRRAELPTKALLSGAIKARRMPNSIAGAARKFKPVGSKKAAAILWMRGRTDWSRKTAIFSWQTVE
jgi:hypothetical protein